MAFEKGKSGNPKGRPPGSSLSGKLREAVGKEFDALLAAVINAAKAGDMSAASLLLARVVPAVKPIQEPIRLDIPGDTLTEKAGAMLDAVARGDLAPMDAKALLDGLGAVAKITEVDELKRRIEALEERAHGRA
ncbi:DUF5681 domain-containing protein [Methylomagnum sp.]